MKVIIAGSRDVTDYDVLLMAIAKSGFNITEVVSGTANGADKLGERYAKNNGIPVDRYLADWKKHGKRAGYLRNEEMADCSGADGLIALWKDKSRGTGHMIDLAMDRGLQVCVEKI